MNVLNGCIAQRSLLRLGPTIVILAGLAQHRAAPFEPSRRFRAVRAPTGSSAPFQVPDGIFVMAGRSRFGGPALTRLDPQGGTAAG